MFSVEIRINGEMIKHIKGQNMGFETGKDMRCIYDYQMYDVVNKTVDEGTLVHDRKEGMNELLMKILMNVEKK